MAEIRHRVSLERVVRHNLRGFARDELNLRRGIRQASLEMWAQLGTDPTDPNSPLSLLYLALGGERRTRTYFLGLFDRGRLRFVKIGMSDVPANRLEQMRTGSPLELQLLASLPALLCDEHQVHHAFRGLRRFREWFAATRTIRRFIDEVKQFQARAGWVWAPDR